MQPTKFPPIEGLTTVSVPDPVRAGKQRMHLICTTVAPEFTCLCPWSDMPDFARLTFYVAPACHTIELKSLKLYLNSWRDVHCSHENVVAELARVYEAVIAPYALLIEGAFHVRGGIFTRVYAGHNTDAFGKILPLPGENHEVRNV